MRLGRGTRALSEAGTRSRRGAVLLSLEQGADSRPVCGVVALLLTGGSLCRPGSHPLCSAQLRAPRLATSPSLPLVSQEGAQAEGSTGWGPRRPEAGVHRARPWPPRVGWLVTALGTSFPLSPAKRRPSATRHSCLRESSGRGAEAGLGEGRVLHRGRWGWGPLLPGSIWEGIREAVALGQVLESERESSQQRGRGKSVSTAPAGLGPGRPQPPRSRGRRSAAPACERSPVPAPGTPDPTRLTLIEP